MKKNLKKFLIILLIIGVIGGIVIVNLPGQSSEPENMEENKVSVVSGWILENNGKDIIMQEGSFENLGNRYHLVVSEDTIIYRNAVTLTEVDEYLGSKSYIEVTYTLNSLDRTSEPLKINEVTTIIVGGAREFLTEGEILEIRGKDRGIIKVEDNNSDRYTFMIRGATIYEDGVKTDPSKLQVGQRVRVLFGGTTGYVTTAMKVLILDTP